MKLELFALGYGIAEIDAMDPPRAAAIIANGTPTSKRPQKKPKSQRDRFELRFTCNVCNGPNSHSISRKAYANGTVLVTCPGCQTSHLIADHLNWIEDDFKTLEQYMAARGSPVTRVVTNSSAASAAERAAADSEERDADDSEEMGLRDDASTPQDEGEDGDDAPVDPRRPWRGTLPAVKPLDGISDEQAARIRDAVRRRKRRQRGSES